MTADAHRRLRAQIGARVLAGLDEDEAAVLRAHLDGCEECRREATELSPIGELLSRADPARLAPTPRPPASLAGLVLARIREERRARRQRRLRLALAGAGAALVLGGGVLAGAALLGSPGPDEPAEPQPVVVRHGAGGLDLSAQLFARHWGTEIHVYVHGAKPGEWCRVFVRDRGGGRLAAGSFRYARDTHDASPSFSIGLTIDQIRALEIEAGNRTLVAPLRSRATEAGS